MPASAPDVREAVIVDIVHGADPGKVAELPPGQHLTCCSLNPRPVSPLSCRPTRSRRLHVITVVEVTPDLVVAHVPMGSQTALAPAKVEEPQIIKAAQRRVGLLRSVTADVDGIDDSRIKIDVAVFNSGVDARHPD